MLSGMTTRSFAVTLITIGLALAALAGIPALVENRSLGDIVVVCGFALAIAGLVLLCASIPGVRRTKNKAARELQADIDDLFVKRARIADQIRNVDLQIGKLKMSTMMGARLGDAIANYRGIAQESAIELRALEMERINLFAELKMNANDLRRKGVDDPERSPKA